MEAVLPRQAAPVRDAARGAASASPISTIGAGAEFAPRRDGRSPTRSTPPADVRPGPAGVLARRADVRGPHAARHASRPFAARRPAERLQHSRRRRPRRWRSTCRSARSKPGLRQLADVPGRFQVVSERADDVRVVVDYAHTDDALKNLLETARPLAAGRIITVFGCGGDRDSTKRPLMGAVAARLSDLVIVTSDNPRSEDPEQIIDEIKRGIVMPADRHAARWHRPRRSRPPCLAITDRKAAIERAMREARAGDLVLIAGKGHEKYQVIGERSLPFDDVEVARAALARRRTGSQSVVAAWIGCRSPSGDIAAATGGRLDRAATSATSRRDLDRLAGDRRRRTVRRDSRRSVRRARVRRPTRSRAARAARWSTSATRLVEARAAAVRGARDPVVVAIRRPGAAGHRSRGPAAIGREGRRDHRQRGKDDDERGGGGVSGDALPRVSEQGQLEQPHRPAALAARAAVATRDRGRRARHESSGRNPHARRHRRTGRPRVDQRRRRAPRASSRRPTPSRMPRRRFSSRRDPDDVLVANADDDRISARVEDFAGRVVTFGIDATADVRATSRRRTAASTGRARACADAGRRRATSRRRSSVSATCRTCWRRRRWRCSSTCRSTRSPGRAAHLRPAQRSRRAAAAARRRDPHRRFVQLESVGAAARARHVIAARRGSARQDRGARRDARARRRTPTRLHEECGAAAAAPDSTCSIAVGGAPAQAMADAAIAARHAGGVGRPRRRRAPKPPTSRSHASRPGDLVLVKGSRGIGTDVVVDRLKAEFA